MRIALIIPSNILMAPYLRYYTDLFDSYGLSYDIIFWDRLGIEEPGTHSFKLKSSETKHYLGKIIDYLRYQHFVKVKIAEGRYDKLIVFTILNALLLYPLLKHKYRGSYVFDIRDYSVTLSYFRARMSAVVQDAAMTVISSAGFKKWLPKDTVYVVRHNTACFEPEKMLASNGGKTKYKILTIGSLRDFEANQALIEQLKDSSLFEMEFVGSGPAEPLLKDLVAVREIKNVKFHGRYAKQDEPKYLQGVSLINIMTNEDINSMTLMSNRFYLSVVYGIPMIVCDYTEQAKWVEKYDLGVVINKQRSIGEQIRHYLEAFNHERYEVGRKACLQVIQQDTEQFEVKVKDFLAIKC